MKAYAIIAAAGIGRRMGGDLPKQYLSLYGRPIICHTLDLFTELPAIHGVVIAVEPDRIESFKKEIVEDYAFPSEWRVVGGGAVRQQSVANALEHIPSDCDVVVVQDGVRPFVPRRLIEESVVIAMKEGACIVAAPVKDTIKRELGKNLVAETVDRHGLWRAQTPQSFRREILVKAMAGAQRDGFLGTDESSLVERIGVNVRLLEGDDTNIKITTPSDIAIAEAILKRRRSL